MIGMAGERWLGCLGVSFCVTAAALAVAATAGGIARSPSQPDLAETAVVVSQRTVPAGASVRVTDVIRNLGLAAASRSTAGYSLLPGRVRLGRRLVGSLQPRASSRRSLTLKIPTTVVPGRYRVQACADERRRIRESDEANNCRVAARLLTITRGVDRTPPKFGGLKAATTCIPGPIGEERMAAYHLTWDAGRDDVTPASGLVYEIYQATTTGGEAFATPTYATSPGETTFTTPVLPSTKTFYFVVRARDRAGNRDSNKIERMGVNLCL